jgi:hypothetical protein
MTSGGSHVAAQDTPIARSIAARPSAGVTARAATQAATPLTRNTGIVNRVVRLHSAIHVSV